MGGRAAERSTVTAGAMAAAAAVVGVAGAGGVPLRGAASPTAGAEAGRLTDATGHLA